MSGNDELTGKIITTTDNPNEFDFKVEAPLVGIDPSLEAKLYLSRKDVYEIFKGMTWNLVIQRPKDPIKSMISQLKVIQESIDEKNKKNKSEKN